MRNLFILGLTGPTGAGKSIVARHLELRGFSHLDADKAARAVVEPSSPCLLKLAEVFGHGILRPDGSLDRGQLAKLAFAGGRVEELNAVTHPFIMDEIKEELAVLKEAGTRVAVLDAPALFESGADKLCDRIAVVTASAETRFARIVRRDGITAEQARARVDAQPDRNFYTSRADYIIENDADETALLEAVDRMADWIAAEAQSG